MAICAPSVSSTGTASAAATSASWISCALGGRRPPQHVIQHLGAIARVADADAQPPEPVAHLRDHVAHAVVAGGAAALLEAHDARPENPARRSATRIDSDGHLVEGRDAAHRLAAVVHVAHRLQQPQLALADARARQLALVARLAAEHRAVTLRQLVHEPEAGVVTRARVLGARVAEPDDQLERLAGHVVSSHRKRRRRPPRADGATAGASLW